MFCKITWSSFLSLRPSQAATATREEAEEELAAALTFTLIVVAKKNNNIVVEEETGLAVEVIFKNIKGSQSGLRRSILFYFDDPAWLSGRLNRFYPPLSSFVGFFKQEVASHTYLPSALFKIVQVDKIFSFFLVASSRS